MTFGRSPLGPAVAAIQQMAQEEFEAKLARIVPEGQRDRWIAIARDEVDRAYDLSQSYPAPARWFIEEARERVYGVAASGMSADEFRPIRDVSPRLALGPGQG